MKKKVSNIRRHTRELVFSAILAALGVVFMIVASMFEVLDLTMCAAASLLIVLAVIEIGYKWPILIYLVTGILSALLLPNKFAAAVYILFAGLYPIFKAIFERMHYVVTWVLKFSFFDTALLLVIAVTVHILHLEETGLGYTIPVMLLANVAFLLYDFVLTKLITLYIHKIRRLLGMKNYFE